MEIELGASHFWHGLPGSASKKNLSGYPGNFKDEPGKFWPVDEKILRFVLKFPRMYFYSRIIFFWTAMLQRMSFFSPKRD